MSSLTQATNAKYDSLVNNLIKNGHIDRQESRNRSLTRKDSTMSHPDDEPEETPDKLIETIVELGIHNKDLLFLGKLQSLQSFSIIIRQLRSLENVQLSSAAQISRRKASKEADSASGSVTPPPPTITINCRENTKDVAALNYISNHLDTASLRTVIGHVLDALRPQGYFVMREHLQGSASGDNLTDKFHFRDPSVTCNMLNSITTADGLHGLQLISALSPDPVGGQQEMTWLYQKVAADAPAKQLQQFLDAQQYTKKGILKYEQIFGDRFVSTGGARTTKEFCQLLQLQRGQTVLDVGCGIGGSGFFMSEEYGAHVYGIDLSSNMISIGIDRRRTGGFHGVDFEISNVLTREFAPNSFDVVYSRDVILHIAEKKKLFEDIYNWLKPGGKLFITDYCCGVKEHNPDFQEYVKQRGYILLTVPAYGKLLEDVGFVNVRAEDRTKQFIGILRTELQNFEPQQSEFVENFSQEDYDEIVDGWNAKVKRCSAGDQAWGSFLAEKK
ncbi:Phosphoethanolamine N-methyltransferase 1 [Hypsibius exemplaris]|uniref:phosphoethanolamine N-methyltransferase n=1 Tax=Hypsibius exemplaris TaxID=2072580 RepID=A0A1W0WLZ9_HYPEX|nr:Phosphoethanolamine N-methyltransferase 1 [Hypsibius exemplaris]